MSRGMALGRAALRRHPIPAVRPGDKDAHGRLLIIAGSRETPGSAAITATAALRSGAGRVSVATVEPLALHLALAIPETLVIALPMGRDGGISGGAVDELLKHLGRFDAVVAGPGMKQGRPCERLAGALLGAGLDRLVLDAAMLRALPAHDASAKAAPTPILLPHASEMAALLDCDEEEVSRDPEECGRQCARRYGALVLVKGAESHVVAPDGASWKYSGGGPGLGVSGSGDALAGICGGLLARGADPLAALLWSVWLHGEAGATLGRKIGPVGYLAREIAGEVPALLEKAQPSFK